MRRASKVLGARVGGPRWLCRLLGLRLGRHSVEVAAGLVEAPCSAYDAAGRNGMVSWSCTGLGNPGCVRRLEQQQADLCIVVAEVVGSAAAVCSSRLAAY